MDYKKILEGVVNIINTTEKSDIGFANICAYIDEKCPELKESEDERIRKELINYFKYGVLTPEHPERELIESFIAWLEKQGENTYNKELSELLHKVICRFINDPDIPYSDREKVSMKVLPYVERLEKQGEQMPVDKVEPKFHVGDIVKRKDNPHLTYILKRFTDDGDYEFHAIGKDGHEGCTCFSIVKYQDEWELVEQKPAETEKGTNGNEREIPNFAWNEEDEEMLNSFLHKLEVCDLLSNKESIWIKNKLKSLKDRVGCEVNCTTTNEWSEEDKKVLQDIIYNIRLEATKHLPSPLTKGKSETNLYIDWLKSLKNKLQFINQEWSKKDEDKLNRIYEILPKCIDCHPIECKELQDWLKSLRPQKHWKPTEAQLASLEIACDRNDRVGFDLTELLKGLKKLRGE